MVYDNNLVTYNRGLELYEKQKYGPAKKQFEKAVDRIGNQNSELSANAHYYNAACALELFHKDAEFLLKEFIKNYSTSTRVEDAWFLLGNYNFRKKKWEESIEFYDELQVITLNEPRKSEYLFKKGYSYFQLDSLDQAASLFYQMEDQTNIYFAPGTYYLGHINYDQKKYAAALKSFKRLENHDQFGSVVPYYIIQIYHFQENFDEVISYGTPLLESKSIKRKPEISRVIGDAHYNKEEYETAVPLLETFIQSNIAKQKEDYDTLGYALYRSGKSDRAAEQFSKISYADDAIGQSALYQMGEAYLRAGKKSYAGNAYKSASRMDFDPKVKEDAMFKFALVSYELAYDPYDGAIEAFKQYAEAYPNTKRAQEAYDYLVNIYLTSKDYDAALSSIDAYENPDIRLREAYQRIAYNRGVELYEERKFDQAKAYFDRSLKYRQSKQLTSLSHYWKSECNYYQENYDEAIKGYEEFIYSPGAALTPFFNLANYNVGYAYFQQDKFLEAPSWFRRYTSVRQDPDSVKIADANLRIGDCYFMLNQYDAAQIYYSEAVQLGKSDPDYALYQKSVTSGLLKKQNDKLIGLQALVKEYPKSRYLDASFYEIGRTLIAMGEDKKALESLNRVVADFPGSSYVRKALVSIGQTHYNAGRDDEAAKTFEKIIKDYPTYEDSREALIGLKNIYIDRGDAAGYESYVSGLGFVDFSESARDSLYYEGAESHYFDGNCKETVEALTKYLSQFKKPIFGLNAHYYRADCLLRMGRAKDALADFEYVADKPKNKFTEPALVQVAKAAYDRADCAAALAYYKRLSMLGEYPENLLIAELGQMRCNYQLKNLQGTIASATIAMEMDNINEKQRNESNLMVAKANLELGSPTEAAHFLEIVRETGSNSQAAEATYLTSRLLFNRDSLDSAEALVFQVIENYRSESFWVAKALILLSDIYMTKGDLFQAKATLEAVIENYKEGGEILVQARQKLDDIIEIENRPLKEFENEIEIDLNAIDTVESPVLTKDTIDNE
ncbi:MAG: tetratricopeptide repeat protein [Salibacteraceae bacterium]